MRRRLMPKSMVDLAALLASDVGCLLPTLLDALWGDTIADSSSQAPPLLGLLLSDPRLKLLTCELITRSKDNLLSLVEHALDLCGGASESNAVFARRCTAARELMSRVLGQDCSCFNKDTYSIQVVHHLQLHTEDVWLRCRSALQRAQPGNTDQEGRVLDTHEVARVLELVLGAIESRLSAEALDVLDVPFLLQHLECVGVARLVERVMYNLLQDQQQQQAVHPLPGCASSTPEEQQQQQQPKRVPSMQPHELVQGLLLCAARHLACTPCSRTGCAVDLLQLGVVLAPEWMCHQLQLNANLKMLLAAIRGQLSHHHCPCYQHPAWLCKLMSMLHRALVHLHSDLGEAASGEMAADLQGLMESMLHSLMQRADAQRRLCQQHAQRQQTQPPGLAEKGSYQPLAEQQQQQQEQEQEQQSQEHIGSQDLLLSSWSHTPLVCSGTVMIPFLALITTLACSHKPTMEAVVINSAVFPKLICHVLPSKPLLCPPGLAVFSALNTTLQKGSMRIVQHLLGLQLMRNLGRLQGLVEDRRGALLSTGFMSCKASVVSIIEAGAETPEASSQHPGDIPAGVAEAGGMLQLTAAAAATAASTTAACSPHVLIASPQIQNSVVQHPGSPKAAAEAVHLVPQPLIETAVQRAELFQQAIADAVDEKIWGPLQALCACEKARTSCWDCGELGEVGRNAMTGVCLKKAGPMSCRGNGEKHDEGCLPTRGPPVPVPFHQQRSALLASAFGLSPPARAMLDGTKGADVGNPLLDEPEFFEADPQVGAAASDTLQVEAGQAWSSPTKRGPQDALEEQPACRKRKGGLLLLWSGGQHGELLTP